MRTPIQVVLYFQEELKSFKYFVDRSEKHWKKDLVDYQKSLNSDELTNQFDYRRDLWASLETIYPQYQRQSHLVMLMSMFEDFLNQLCLSVKDHCKLTVDLSNSNGKGIDRAKNYLNQKTILKLPTSSQEWSHIQDAYKIRNIIVHNGACLLPERHKIQYDIISVNNNLTVENYARNELIVHSEYLLELINDIVEFTKKTCVIMLKEECFNFNVFYSYDQKINVNGDK